MFKSVLVLCTGNICRSPYAEAVIKQRAARITVDSAGLSAMVDYEADATGQAVARDRGIDMSAHKGKQVTRSLIGRSDLILVMDDEHLSLLHRKYPDSRGKSFKLGKLKGDKNIVDPYLKSHSFFKLVFNEIDEAVDTWLPHLN
jgi:protein-tyrosine phosphatase